MARVCAALSCQYFESWPRIASPQADRVSRAKLVTAGLPFIFKVVNSCRDQTCRGSSFLDVATGKADRRERLPPVPRHCALIAMRFTFSCALVDFGSTTLSTPFLNDALTLSSSTSSSGIRRSKFEPAVEPFAEQP